MLFNINIFNNNILFWQNKSSEEIDLIVLLNFMFFGCLLGVQAWGPKPACVCMVE